jgi:hypothetical protein
VRIPTLLLTGQPTQGIQGADLSVLGLDVRLTTRVRWHWDYGDGTDVWASSPGRVWPSTLVSRVHLTAGRRCASAESVRRAEFTMEGFGPFAVPGAPLTQNAALIMVVRAARTPRRLTTSTAQWAGRHSQVGRATGRPSSDPRP